jgi:hypothetical protein
MPPGHLNAIFIKDATKLNKKTWRQGIDAAAAQEAFIFWNHPGWRGQQDDGIAKWYEEHTEILESGKLHGIEVVNEKEYYPEAHQWCLDKDLTMMSNSDIHNPIQMDYNFPAGEHRPMTLVFAKERSIEAIKEALFARRTIVYSNKFLYGKKEFLEPLFYNSIFIKNPEVVLSENKAVYIQITNYSDMDYHLQRVGAFNTIDTQSDVWLYAGKTVLYRIENPGTKTRGKKKVNIPFQVENLKTAPDERLPVYLDLTVIFK